MRLYEYDKKGKKAKSNDHGMLFHLTDHHGFAYTVDRDSLESPEGISTTTDPNRNSVEGRWHYDFKFVLSPSIIDAAGAHHYTSHYQYVNDRESWHDWNEAEVRLDAHKIQLSPYLMGTVLLFDLFSETGVQWLLYGNYGREGGMFSKKTSAAPRAVDMLYKHLYEWKKPIWKGKVGKMLTKQEMQFIRDAYELSKRNATFAEGLIELCRKYPIVSHWGKPMDAEMARRQFLAPKLVKMLNGYYVDRDRTKIKIPQVKKLIERIFNAIGIGNNAVAALMHRIEEAGLFHVMTPPVVWGGIIRDVMDGDVEAAFSTIDFLGQREASTRHWYDNSAKDDFIRKGMHYGTSFGRGSVHR